MGPLWPNLPLRTPVLGLAINEIRIRQLDTIVFISLISATQEQWELSENKLQTLIDTFTPLDTSPVELQTAEEAPVWVLTGPTSNQFGFFAPSDWETLSQNEHAVAIGQPDSDLRFEAQVSPWTGAKPALETAEAVALSYLTTLSETYKMVEHSPPAEFPLNAASGMTVDFLYFTEKEGQIAGSIITAAHEGQIYQIVFTAPVQAYEGALQWFNPMYQSFTFLAPEEFLDEE